MPRTHSKQMPCDDSLLPSPSRIVALHQAQSTWTAIGEIPLAAHRSPSWAF